MTINQKPLFPTKFIKYPKFKPPYNKIGLEHEQIGEYFKFAEKHEELFDEHGDFLVQEYKYFCIKPMAVPPRKQFINKTSLAINQPRLSGSKNFVSENLACFHSFICHFKRRTERICYNRTGFEDGGFSKYFS